MASRASCHRSLAEENAPETERFVASARADRLAIRAHRQVQDAERVTGKCRKLRHAWQSPDDNLVLRVPMRAHELVARATPRQVAHLRTCVKRANRRLR
eukprot:CAMPEP_0206131394 /NCGR_PEP_ID=MMETSP1472-20131121/44901_1 /ASSEMBLY_ACC=CAM_ASM_001108 /TAXON_ID=41880 /ORGANISM="Pycnococcus provasolii, Strain RCC251" /LENGTH=98 /DNA_ID=CAMNT_0053522837 /DNA_START=84 /DNA_END=378 /DNA_ORIENTATION=+